jgi:hypothetical protein
MAVLVPGSFADLQDVRFTAVATDEYQKIGADYVPVLYGVTPPTTPWRADERYSEISGFPQMGQFTGSVDYLMAYQGYDTTATYAEFAAGHQVSRRLVETDQFNVIDDLSRKLARSAFRRRQFDATRPWRNGFSIDTTFYNRTEGVALFSNSHTTTTGTSTAAGFDNLITGALNATNLATAQIQAANLRDLQSEPFDIALDTILCPFDLYETAWEIVSSMGQLTTANNNRNVHYGAYTLIFIRNKKDFPDVNDWFALDGTLLKDLMLWFDQVYPGGMPEFGTVEDFDTFNAKHRAYMVYTQIARDWRFGIGAQVS